ncbi:MAG TPA: CAP domain-containing protein [Gaiellaceae bacterium]
MKSRLIALIAAALVIVPAASAATLTASESALLSRMNAIRAVHGLRPLSADDHLQRAAVAHSREMIATDVFAHGAFGARLAHFDVSGHVIGENLAWGVGSEGTAAAVVAAWLASPEHRANLLRPGFTRVGVASLSGTFEGHAGADVVTADFAG